MSNFMYAIPISAILYDGNNYNEIKNSSVRYQVQADGPDAMSNAMTINGNILHPNQYLVFWPTDSYNRFMPIVYDRPIFEGRFNKLYMH
jgi:hypothetical protein